MRFLTARLVAVTAGFAATIGAAAQPARPPFLLSTWGVNGTLIPFAEFDGARWRAAWPESTEVPPEIPELRAIPSRWWGKTGFVATWEVLELGGRRHAVQITGTDRDGMGSSCSANVGLATNVPTRKVDQFSGRPEYVAAVAATLPGAVDAVHRVDAGSSDGRALRALVPSLFRRHEHLIAPVVARQGLDAAVDLRSSFSLTAYAEAQTDDQFVFFEASRTMSRARYAENVVMQGWLHRRTASSGFQLVALDVDSRDSDGKGMEQFRPLGVVRENRRHVWISSSGSYAYSGLTLRDVRRGGVKEMLRVDYPGC